MGSRSWPRPFLAVLSLLGASFAALGDESKGAAPDDSSERRKLVGTWKGYVVDGKSVKADRGPVKLELIITETTIHGIEIKQDGTGGKTDHGSGEYRFDVAADPKHLDAWQKRPNGQKSNHLGIYKLEGDTLRWCVTKGKNRPTDFATGKGCFLVVVKRDGTK